MEKGGDKERPAEQSMEGGKEGRGEKERSGEGTPAVTSPRRSWMVMRAIARIVSDNSPLLMATEDFSIQFAEPPRASILNVARRIHPDGFHPSRPYLPFILNVHSDHLLLYTTHGGHTGGRFYLCNAYTGVAIRLPPPPERPINPRRCVGLIEDPSHRGHFLVAQLHPTSTTQHNTLISYSTGTSTWEIKRLSSSPHHQGCNGSVLAHDGRLWWADPPLGLLTLDPFANAGEPHLRHVALPEGRGARMDNIKHQCVKASEGKLRYVQIDGFPDAPAVTMNTLIDPDGAVWKMEYKVGLDEIWADDGYKQAGLTPGKVPAIALVDPNNYGILYFLLDGILFAVNMCTTKSRVLHFEKFLMGAGVDGFEKYQDSRFVYGWKLLHPLPLRPAISPSEMDKHENGNFKIQGETNDKSHIGQNKDSTVVTAAEAAREFFTTQLEEIRKKKDAAAKEELNKKAEAEEESAAAPVEAAAAPVQAAEETKAIAEESDPRDLSD